MSGVQHREVSADDDGIRLDRWFSKHFPQVGFARLQKLIRNGEVKVDKAKFTRKVVPGDVLEMRVRIKRVIRNMAVYECEAFVDGEPAACAEVLCAGTRE